MPCRQIIWSLFPKFWNISRLLAEKGNRQAVWSGNPAGLLSGPFRQGLPKVSEAGGNVPTDRAGPLSRHAKTGIPLWKIPVSFHIRLQSGKPAITPPPSLRDGNAPTPCPIRQPRAATPRGARHRRYAPRCDRTPDRYRNPTPEQA